MKLQGACSLILAVAGACIGFPAVAAIPGSERAVLDAINQSTGGTQWSDATGREGSSGTECGWKGLTCNAAQSNIIGIALSQNNLKGALPSLDAATGKSSVHVRPRSR